MKFLISLLIIYLLFRLLTRFLFPFLAKRYVDKAKRNFEQNQGYTDPEEAKKKEGEINIKTKPKSSKQEESKKDLGDYIDFEEVDQNQE